MGRKIGIAAIVLLLLASGAGMAAWSGAFGRHDALPEGIVGGNGRIEADEVNVAPKVAGRVTTLLASEGNMVTAGEVLARMDTDELEAERDGAAANAALARGSRAEAEAVIAQRESELELAEHDLARAQSLLDRGTTPVSSWEEKRNARNVAQATLAAARAHVTTLDRQIAAADADLRQVEAQIDDATLRAPVTGRVLYRLAETGEVVAAGVPVMTVLDLSDVYIEIFLPAEAAGRVALGADARIVLDALPGYAIPASVSFVSPKAQFTPKQVETMSEREKLVFKVRVRIDPERVRAHLAEVKTGLRGLAYVRLSPKVAWPAALDRRIPAELLE